MRSKLMMSKSEKNFSRQGAKPQSLRCLRVSLCAFAPLREKTLLFLLVGLIVISAGCHKDMQSVPNMKPYRSTTIFTDGVSTRHTIEHTIPRDTLRTETLSYSGKNGRSTHH